MRSAQENGTIFVFAANNDYQDQVSKEAGLPYYINELAAQFLAVMAIDTDLKKLDSLIAVASQQTFA